MQNTNHDGGQKKKRKGKKNPSFLLNTTPKKNPLNGNGRDHNVQPKPCKTNVEQ
jgi:hypothetical protein